MFISISGEEMVMIRNAGRLDPFLMSIVSSDDHWMYVSSTGCLTAGRKHSENALFPYVTDDLLHVNGHFTGPITVIKLKEANGKTLKDWEPFSLWASEYQIERNLYKGAIGNSVVFEEINLCVGLVFRYQWFNSRKFGFIRRATLINNNDHSIDINLVDGLQNVMPSGIALHTQQTMSNLANAYKISEYFPDTNCALFSLNALLLDRPEPGESLRTNVVWCSTQTPYLISISNEMLKTFKREGNFIEQHRLTGKSGSFLINMTESLPRSGELSWDILADVNKTQAGIAFLERMIQNTDDLEDEINNGIRKGTEELRINIGSADGFQVSNNEMEDLHHTSNVLFNIMRGGVFVDNYIVEKNNFFHFLNIRNKEIAEEFSNKLSSFPESIEITGLLKLALKTKNSSFIRLCHEYLPLTFGRRHGDPSRPWNYFNIQVKDKSGVQLFCYEGNWRDIFQNWEALAHSYPETFISMVCKFLNACTADGYNPYRITERGIEWEVIDQNDPWSYIGYWNDHQIIYLLKLMEHLHRYDNSIIPKYLGMEIFSYTNIPYRIKDFKSILDNPKQTIDFDSELNSKVDQMVHKIGTDGKLIFDSNQGIYHVNMCEKLLVLVLSKMSNFIPEGGIWMNTQRPEWNDANNALVGNGLSMVTLCYLRRYIIFFRELLLSIEVNTLYISIEVSDWLKCITSILESDTLRSYHDTKDPEIRMKIICQLGSAFSDYREKIYRNGFSGKQKVKIQKVGVFLDLTMKWLDETIRSNKKNNLFHAYNIIRTERKHSTAFIDNLYPMLEGQVAALSSGVLNSDESIDLLGVLFKSKMFRLDQDSFMLYPENDVISFMEKNIIPTSLVKQNKLLSKMLAEENTDIIDKDIKGQYRFNPDLKNSFDLYEALEKLEKDDLHNINMEKQTEKILEIFEIVFEHRSFTGRSGTMFAYEGIGSIYWHMVSKLLLAVQEVFFKGVSKMEDTKTLKTIGRLYYKIRSGLSSTKTPHQYGAFPFDPYSHTPKNAGAQQPGMTGQVKEEIITRMGELGCFIENGQLKFNPKLLRRSEFLIEEKNFSFINIYKKKKNMTVGKDQLAFTYCQVPIIYDLVDKEWQIEIQLNDGSNENFKGRKISKSLSRHVFKRTGNVRRIRLACPTSELLF